MSEETKPQTEFVFMGPALPDPISPDFDTTAQIALLVQGFNQVVAYLREAETKGKS